jgi:hypothetical protein
MKGSGCGIEPKITTWPQFGPKARESPAAQNEYE